MFKHKVIILFILPFSLISQTISGRIYDQESSINGAKLININNNMISYSNDKGIFKIKASINDTILVSSLFHEKQRIFISKKHFDVINIVELKKRINELNEIILNKELYPKSFNEKTYSTSIKEQIKNDIKLNPYLYGVEPNGNIDFVKIVTLIGKLIKKKKVKDIPKIFATYKALDSLFSNDTFFTDKLLTNDLKIQKKYRQLFFDFCDSKSIDEKLLEQENKFILLDTLYGCSRAFLTVLKENEKIIK